jgi:cytochrome c oxidase subunit 2
MTDEAHNEVHERRILGTELLWAFGVGILIAATLSMIVFTALTRDINPPSNVERIDPKTLHLSGEFAEQNLGTTVAPDGSVTTRIIATQFMFAPRCIAVPQGRRVTLRFATPDVIHGILITGTNVNTMIVPGYVAQVHTEFRSTGELLMPCHEYCGLGHSEMWANVQVLAQNEFKPDQDGRVSCSKHCAAVPCSFLGGFRGFRSRMRPWHLADVGSQPAWRAYRYPWAVFHVGDGAWRRDGLRAHDILHHGLWILRRGHRVEPSASRSSMGVGRFLGIHRWRRDGALHGPVGSGLGAFHLLPTPDGKPVVLHRTGSCCWWFLDLVRSHADSHERMEA